MIIEVAIIGLLLLTLFQVAHLCASVSKLRKDMAFVVVELSKHRKRLNDIEEIDESIGIL